MFLLGNTITAQDAYSRFGLYVPRCYSNMVLFVASVNAVVPPAKVVETALSYAKEIVSNSPDAVQSTKKALLLSQSYNHREAHRQHLKSKEGRRVYAGENIQVGILFSSDCLMSFATVGRIEGVWRGELFRTRNGLDD